MGRISEEDIKAIEEHVQICDYTIHKYAPYNFNDLRDLNENPLVKEQILSYIARST